MIAGTSRGLKEKRKISQIISVTSHDQKIFAYTMLASSDTCQEIIKKYELYAKNISESEYVTNITKVNIKAIYR